MRQPPGWAAKDGGALASAKPRRRSAGSEALNRGRPPTCSTPRVWNAAFAPADIADRLGMLKGSRYYYIHPKERPAYTT